MCLKLSLRDLNFDLYSSSSQVLSHAKMGGGKLGFLINLTIISLSFLKKKGHHKRRA